jgi:septum formation inhibitor-activating ATPase MinD
MLTSIINFATSAVSKTVTTGIDTVVTVKTGYAGLQKKVSNITTDLGVRNIELIERIALSNPSDEVVNELQEVVNKYSSLQSTIMNNMAMEVAIKVLISKYDIKLNEKKEVKEESIGDMLKRIKKHNLCK